MASARQTINKPATASQRDGQDDNPPPKPPRAAKDSLLNEGNQSQSPPLSLPKPKKAPTVSEHISGTLNTKLTGPEKTYHQTNNLLDNIGAEKLKQSLTRQGEGEHGSRNPPPTASSRPHRGQRFSKKVTRKMHPRSESSDDSDLISVLENFQDVKRVVEKLKKENVEPTHTATRLSLLADYLKEKYRDSNLLRQIHKQKLGSAVVNVMKQKEHAKHKRIQVCCCEIITLLCHLPESRQALLRKKAGRHLFHLIKNYANSKILMAACLPAVNNLYFPDKLTKKAEEELKQYADDKFHNSFRKLFKIHNQNPLVRTEALYVTRTLALHKHAAVFTSEMVTAILLSGFININEEDYCFSLLETLNDVYLVMPEKSDFVKAGYGELLLLVLKKCKASAPVLLLALRLACYSCRDEKNAKLLCFIPLTRWLLHFLCIPKAYFDYTDTKKALARVDVVYSCLHLLVIRCDNRGAAEKKKLNELGTRKILKQVKKENKTKSHIVKKCEDLIRRLD